jgi:hypothetical protein
VTGCFWLVAAYQFYFRSVCSKYKAADQRAVSANDATIDDAEVSEWLLTTNRTW